MDTKICKKCNHELTLDDFKKHPENADGRSGSCRKCTNEMQRRYRAESHNQQTHKYEKTKNGFLMRTYRNMESRVTGIQWKKSHLYADKELLSRDEFYSWSMSNPDFHILFDAWEWSGYDHKLTPSIDRVKSTLGYSLDNMRWITHSENSRLGAMSRYGKLQTA